MLAHLNLNIMNSKMAQGLPQDLSPEEGTLCLLNDLLVHRLRRVVHDHGALLVVDLGIDTGVADQVDDPLLTLVLAEAETGGQVPKNEVSYIMTGALSISSTPPQETYLISIRWWILQ